jgi:hypothetical protein
MSHNNTGQFLKSFPLLAMSYDKWRVPSGRKGTPFRRRVFAAIKQPLVIAAKRKRGISIMCSLKIRHCLVASLFMLSLLTCAAQKGINGEATYFPFEVPGALGTYPISVNNSMAVTGYYFVSPTTTRGFVRDAGGAITTFDVLGSLWTEPKSINDAGEITGFYEVVAGVPQSFIRYADGQIITFNPPCTALPLIHSASVSINASGEIVGNCAYLGAGASAVFTRSREGVFTGPIGSDRGAAYGAVATDINASGIVVGYSDSSGEDAGFGGPISIPVPADQEDCLQNVIPESINAEGTIAGWYWAYTSSNGCGTQITRGFVVSPDGVTTLFNPPGKLVTYPEEISLAVIPLFPRSISINQEGSITGSYTDTEGAQHGFVRNHYGTITKFDPPKGRQTTATSINDCGVIVGSYYYDWNAKTTQGFLRVPHLDQMKKDLPEPVSEAACGEPAPIASH